MVLTVPVDGSTRTTEDGELLVTHKAPNPYRAEIGPGPASIGAPDTRFVAGSTRISSPIPSVGRVTQTYPPPVATPTMGPPTGIVATTRLLFGSIR